MPLPWKPELLQSGPRHLARNGKGPRSARQNGITLGQLRSLQNFVRRLCKAGLLKVTSEFVKELIGTRIRWTELNMHGINEEVIKKVIPQEDSCSWVEIVTEEEQVSNFFVSHNWAEAFRDFMHSLEMHAATMACRIHDIFFVCTFANDQWNLDLGAHLEMSPFFLALKDAEHVVLVLDKQASALERLWCTFEITTAMEMNKDLGMATPLGLIGEKRISSGPALEALKGVDIRMGKASNAVDQRQILNHIAGIREEEGLKVDDGGKKVLENTQPASNGSPFDYEYEEQLVRTNASSFEKLNAKISEYATSEKLRQQEAKGCTVPDVGRRGMSLAQLRAMVTVAKKYCFHEDRKEWRVKKEIKAWTDVTVIHLLDPFLKEKAQEAGKLSYMEVVSSGEQKPEYVVTCALTTKVADMLASIEWHAEARRLPDSATYWIISTASSREEVDDYIAKHKRPPSSEAMPYVEGMVAVLDASATLLTRSLPAIEVFEGLEKKVKLDLVCPTGALATTAPFQEGWEFGNFDPSIARHMMKYDVRNIAGRKIGTVDHPEMVKCMIAGIQYEEGMKAPADSPLYDSFNERIRSKALGPVLREAAYEGNFEAVREVLSQRGKTPADSKAFQGHSGEMAIHAAAAGGHSEIVQLLINERASPNYQDDDGETPLHYAALAGQKEATRVLLHLGADPSIESYFGETPVQVAMQNGAAFLGVDTRGVVDLLEVWQASRCITNGDTPGLREARVKTLLEIFQFHDRSGTGVISETDMEAVFRHLHFDLAPSVRQMCKEAGKTSKDGLIDYREFLGWLFEMESEQLPVLPMPMP